MSRFDYVQYDEQAQISQATLKKACENIEALVGGTIKDGRAKSSVMTKLEEAYMWMGKGIRDDQIARNGIATPQESRTSS